MLFSFLRLFPTGRMTLLVTIFLVLINIFNTIQTNSPKAEGLTAIEAWVIACIIFVFGALGEYTVILLKIKLKKLGGGRSKRRGSPTSSGNSANGKKKGMLLLSLLLHELWTIKKLAHLYCCDELEMGRRKDCSPESYGLTSLEA